MDQNLVERCRKSPIVQKFNPKNIETKLNKKIEILRKRSIFMGKLELIGEKFGQEEHQLPKKCRSRSSSRECENHKEEHIVPFNYEDSEIVELHSHSHSHSHHHKKCRSRSSSEECDNQYEKAEEEISKIMGHNFKVKVFPLSHFSFDENDGKHNIIKRILKGGKNGFFKFKKLIIFKNNDFIAIIKNTRGENGDWIGTGWNFWNYMSYTEGWSGWNNPWYGLDSTNSNCHNRANNIYGDWQGGGSGWGPFWS